MLGGGELLLPGEVGLGAGRELHRPVAVRRRYGHGLDELAARFHAHLRARPHHPRSPRPVMLNTWEAVYFDHDLGRLTELADAGPPRSASSASCWTTAGSATAATTTPGSATGTSTSEVWPDGLHPLVDARARAGHGVRAVGRAGDGQPRLRPRPGAPGLDAGHRRAAAAAVAPPAGARPGPTPRRTRYILERLDALLDRVPDRLPQVGPQPRPARGRRTGRGRAGRARADRWRSTGCSTSCARRHPGVEIESCSSRRRPGRPGDPRAHRPGLGQRLHRRRSSASRSSAGPRCCCRPS